ncbi:hypothetical protein CHS0354_001282 [Potamilus streckersoni]|uniref:Uncharacterized protein n=1 Tax=Potamilus streckersoni TaxID=2493646 RepID=A0AAE0S7D9_9BIVA|nr:hypothetical protein CHS0354_001282 [Potamilus streckersoni]
MAYLLMCAYMVEVKIVKNVHLLSENLADVVQKDLNCDKLHAVLLYWKTRCLPPTGLGTLHILGLVAVQDVIHYIQYYSLPIVTVLVTPILKLITSLLHVYTAGTRN